jgi:Holliday junction resolvase-like predicted endonuclease
MNTVISGQVAEQAAARALKARGCQIVGLNWRTKYCEIDIIAIHEKTVVFVEVKYRATNIAGSGLDYITPAKLLHMQRAAELWVCEHNYSGAYRLAAIEVTGPKHEVGELLDDLY